MQRERRPDEVASRSHVDLDGGGGWLDDVLEGEVARVNDLNSSNDVGKGDGSVDAVLDDDSVDL